MVWCGQLSSDSRHYGQGGAPHWIVIIKQHDITHSQAELSLLHHSVWLVDLGEALTLHHSFLLLNINFFSLLI